MPDKKPPGREEYCTKLNVTRLLSSPSLSMPSSPRETCVMVKHKVVDRVGDMNASMRHKLLLSIRDLIKKNALADPDMCGCVKGPIEKSIDLFWGDLMVSIDMTMQDQFDQAVGRHDYKSLSQLGDKPACCSLMWWRAHILYCLLPFDKSIFGQLKDPLFLLLLVISMITWYGIRIAFYFVVLVLILMSNPDEFQIVQFIVMLKGTFFLSAGLIAGVVSSFGYFQCVKPGGAHTCDIDGPAYKLDLVSEGIDLIGSCVLVWAAFISLRWSMHHGWHKVKSSDAELAKRTKHGGHLGGLFIYDALCVVLSCVAFWSLAYMDANPPKVGLSGGGEVSLSPAPGVFGTAAAGAAAQPTSSVLGVLGAPGVLQAPDAPLQVPADSLPPWQEWDYHRAFLFGRMLYALLSTPFVIFRLPPFNTILTHTTMTGYNRQGRCVIYCMPPAK